MQHFPFIFMNRLNDIDVLNNSYTMVFLPVHGANLGALACGLSHVHVDKT